MQAARDRSLTLSKVDQFESASGIGVTGTVDGQPVALGNTALMEQLGVDSSALRQQAEDLRGQGASVMYLAVGGRFAGLLAVSDPVKASTAEALATHLAALARPQVDALLRAVGGATAATRADLARERDGREDEHADHAAAFRRLAALALRGAAAAMRRTGASR